jgi:hypothetical protein
MGRGKRHEFFAGRKFFLSFRKDEKSIHCSKSFVAIFLLTDSFSFCSFP